MASEERSIISKRFRRLFHSPNLGGMSVADPDFQLMGGPSHPDREIRGGPASKKHFFQPFGPHFGLKIRGGRAPVRGGAGHPDPEIGGA